MNRLDSIAVRFRCILWLSLLGMLLPFCGLAAPGSRTSAAQAATLLNEAERQGIVLTDRQRQLLWQQIPVNVVVLNPVSRVLPPPPFPVLTPNQLDVLRAIASLLATNQQPVELLPPRYAVPIVAPNSRPAQIVRGPVVPLPVPTPVSQIPVLALPVYVLPAGSVIFSGELIMLPLPFDP